MCIRDRGKIMSVFQTDRKEPVFLVKEDNIYYLVLNDLPQNQFNAEFLNQINKNLDEVEKAPTGTIMITVSTHDKNFSTGLDVKYLIAGSGDLREQLLIDLQKLLARLLKFPKPSIAIINGHAIGAGLMFVMCHDYRIMREDKGFVSLPEILLGMPIPPGMLASVLGKVPKHIVKNMVFTGQYIDGQTALRYGLVDKLAKNEDLIKAAKEIIPSFSYAAKFTDAFVQIKSQMFEFEYNKLINEPLDAYTCLLYTSPSPRDS
eukprot:TRINITY_DN2469_c0_g1_i16.p1 TRINITY_DN2469_c0_g1~~TRINITY_DN2469_c0_g1_i16.p1  ORF type:complete len:261 (+),score=32.00 TRINITY_DN2469_c0_g1_i16:66-848(+)